jgi:hypothetical protein
MHSVEGLTISIGALGGAMLSLNTSIHGTVGWILDHLPKPPQVYDPTSTVKTPEQLRKELAGKHGVGPVTGAEASLPEGTSALDMLLNIGAGKLLGNYHLYGNPPATPTPTPRPAKTSAVTVNTPITINQQPGQNAQQLAAAVALEVKKSLAGAVATSGQGMQSNIGKHAGGVTTATLPGTRTIQRH